ncbi:UNKNOWN [Stylonychia lemnae]|uniref:Transmembrane protein n=1 Tax=Stylonychia lemnae TaxID=5949 RepID=A0A077ZYP5_STYLE|nr:UNKNOWN [Stylonychia lemnae]|eukprot:CDW73653.1 UNKNOWN [Stylonychia lemnae]
MSEYRKQEDEYQPLFERQYTNGYGSVIIDNGPEKETPPKLEEPAQVILNLRNLRKMRGTPTYKKQESQNEQPVQSPDWQNVFLPLQAFTFLFAFQLFNWYESLKRTHETIYRRLNMHLIMTVVMLSIFYLLLADCLNFTHISVIGRLIRFIPVYIVALSTFSIFMYLLPGLCDPEINRTKRLPFLMMNYFVVSILTIVYFNINGFQIIQKSNGIIMFFPLIFNLVMHLITILTDQLQHKTELLVVSSILAEIIIFSLEWDQSIVIRFSIAIITWFYIYYRIIMKIKYQKLNENSKNGNNNGQFIDQELAINQSQQ